MAFSKISFYITYILLIFSIYIYKAKLQFKKNNLIICREAPYRRLYLHKTLNAQATAQSVSEKVVLSVLLRSDMGYCAVI